MASWGIFSALEYEMEHMIDFVAQSIPPLFAQPISIPGFHAFISAILRSTRLPKATIFLALRYMAHPTTQQSPRHDIRTMCIIPFMAASKYLDDITFHNRSWAKLSGIGLLELNTIERAWLSHRCFHLYVDLDTDYDYLAWQKRWLAQEDRCKLFAQASFNSSEGSPDRRSSAVVQHGASRAARKRENKAKASVHWDGQRWKCGARHVRSSLQGRRYLPLGLVLELPVSTITWNGREWFCQDKVGDDNKCIRHEDIGPFMPKKAMYMGIRTTPSIGGDTTDAAQLQ